MSGKINVRLLGGIALDLLTREGALVPHRVRLYVDAESLMRRMAPSAARSKAHASQLAYGRIRVTVEPITEPKGKP